ncbi:TetR/AcrR family transcriptional regulator [Sporosalibacterium faouarense]|uniref:TetR/AcrR family transcriptional regulator n=1 Tax=Sporosalibacterium faouarense TaxID=516123 RepID=UPI00141C3DCA|nr:TetR/AcrR family transcriptional regulator [Sporosalibacterium faouarense]MTI47625.1 TetR/AcrR family transcriptional regulator [Bacillota bacterium]
MTDEQWIKDILSTDDEDVKLSEKQIKIVEAAIQVFSEKGFSGASTSEIAKKAGVAEGTVFRHFKTKKELLLSIVTPTLAKIVAPFIAKDFVNSVFKDDYASFEDFLKVLIKNRFEFMKKRAPVIKIFLQEIAFHPEIKEEYIDALTTHVKVRVFQLVERFKDKNEIKEYPTETIIRFMTTTVVGFLIARFLILPNNEWDDDKEIEDTIELLLYGLKK